MLLIEGADNVGKSTLIRQFLELDPSLRLLKRERFKPSAGGTIGGSYLKALHPKDGCYSAHANSLADRFFASECIYGALFRNGCRMSAEEHFTIRAMLHAHNAIVVHCDTSDENIMATWTKRDQTYDSPLDIAQAYRRRLKRVFNGFPVIRYDWTDSYAERQRQAIIHQHQESMRIFSRFLLPNECTR